MAMERNPYAAPAAEVVKQTSPSRPLQASLGLLLLCISMFLGPVQAVLTAPWMGPIYTDNVTGYVLAVAWLRGALIPALVISGVFSLWLYGLYRRRRWLYWLTEISGVVYLVVTAWTVARRGTGARLTYYYLEWALLAPAIVLLCLAPSRNWFLHSQETR
jgi:hypothetical protein